MSPVFTSAMRREAEKTMCTGMEACPRNRKEKRKRSTSSAHRSSRENPEIGTDRSDTSSPFSAFVVMPGTLGGGLEDGVKTGRGDNPGVVRLPDYHVHTFRCGHAGGASRDFVRRAIGLGLREIAFTDHIPLYFLPEAARDPRLAMGEEAFDGYVREVEGLREEFRGTIDVRLGLEADYAEGFEDELVRWLSRADWDVVLGSVHWVDGSWIDDLPNGLQTDVGERGARLSLGQRQLVALARVLFQNPSIVLLDEATASIDPFTEAQIQAGLDVALRDRTSVIIAHRLSTVVTADRIIVLREGQIIEQGTHASLLALGGHYADLYQTYFRHQEQDYQPYSTSVQD